jgi:hypothetical protein
MTDFKIDSHFDTNGFIMNNTCEYDIYNKTNILTINNFENAISDIRNDYFSDNGSETEGIETRLQFNFNGRNMNVWLDPTTYGDDMISLTYGSYDDVPTSNGLRYFEFINIIIYNDERPVEIKIGTYISLEDDEGVMDWFDNSSYFDVEGIKSENHFFPKGNCLSDYKLLVRVNEY